MHKPTFYKNGFWKKLGHILISIKFVNTLCEICSLVLIALTIIGMFTGIGFNSCMLMLIMVALYQVLILLNKIINNI